MMSLNISNRVVSANQPVLVIAEIGVNHDGALEQAMRLVRYAADAGADAVKIQLFNAETLMNPVATFAGYQKSRVAESNPVAMLKRYELADLDVVALCHAIREAGMLPLATPFSPRDVDRIGALDLPAVKIASPDVVNLPLLRRSAGLGKPLLVSTGAASSEEIRLSLSWLRELGASVALLHCVSSYPTPADQAHLAWIGDLAKQFATPVGYSDHTTEELAGALAVMAGACIVEKHLTHDRSASGPDHAASADPEQFAAYVRAIRLAETMRGAGSRRVLEIEQDVRTVSRQSLVLCTSGMRGQVIDEDMLTTQRPGTGIPAAELGRVLGKRLIRSARAGEMLKWDMVEAA